MLTAMLTVLALSQATPLEPVRTVQTGKRAPCIEADTTLCLLHDRIEVQVRYRNQHGDGAETMARSIRFGDRTGFFWFFEPGNIEVLVKALDGRDVNESVWVFVASLSDVEFWVEVTDTREGQQRTYHNPPGNTYGIVDTSAFPSSGIGDFCGGADEEACPRDLFCDRAPGRCGVVDSPGICVEPTQACPEIFAPVCGCDGKTYSNDCERIAAGVAKDHDGECGTGGQMCGGIAGIPCPDDSFVCDYEPESCHVADVAGICRKRPEACIEVYDPVCGCDGKTYANDCFRLAAGVAKDRDGECDGLGQMCGGIAGIPCPGTGLFCDFEPGQCSTADVAGVCVQRSEVCPLIYAPVCGCNGKTYGNDCERIAAGAAKDHDGECGSDGKICGGIAGIPCPDASFVCEYEPGTCGILDAPGRCVTRPQGCILIYDPVCGCDGKTYGNDCERLAAGVSKDHDGECDAGGQRCGGLANIQCPDDSLVCEYPKGACAILDGLGTCVERPDGCAAIYDPVCGCDGKTYGNDCERLAAGVTHAHDGPCEE